MASSIETRAFGSLEGSRQLSSISGPIQEPIEKEAPKIGSWVQIALRRLPLILIGLVVGVVGGFFYHLRVVPTYQTSIDVHVVKKRGELNTAQDSRAGYVDDYVSAQSAVIKSPEVMESAAEILEGESDSANSLVDSILGGSQTNDKKSTLGIGGPGNESGKPIQSLKKLPLGASTKAELAAAVHGGLQVIQDEKRKVLVLNFKTIKNPEDTPKILLAVVKAYQEYLKKIYDIGSDRSVQRFEGIITSTNTQFLQLQTDFRAKSEALKKIHPVGAIKVNSGLEDSIKKYEVVLAELKDRRDDLLARSGSKGVLMPNTGTDGSSSGSGNNMPLFLSADENTLDALNLQMKILLIDLGKDHHKVVKLRTQIEYLEEVKNKKAGLAKKDGQGKFVATDPIGREMELNDSRISKYETALQEAQKQQTSLKADLETERELEAQLKDLSTRIETTRKKLEMYEEFKNQIVLTKDHGGYEAKQISKINGPFPSGANRLVFLFVGGVFGLGCGLGLAYLAEVTDRSFQTPDDIRKHLGLSILGHIPTLRLNEDERKPGSKLEDQLITAHKPKSTEAEAYRGLRTGLYFSTQGKGHQVIQITSPNAGDGKSTLSCNLSISIAQSGKKVVLIDADMRKPRVNKIFGIPNSDKGLSTLIEGNSLLEESMFPTEVPNLFLIPCGPRPGNPSELLTSPRFPEILSELREKFDFVMVDTPPVLAVSDPCIVAPRVDGVIVNILLNKNARASATRACEMLANIETRVLGVVVNCFDSRQTTGKYGYGYGYNYGYGYSYNYQYGYKYGYKYGYNYGYSDYKQYSDDTDPSQLKKPSRKQIDNKRA
jgi:capsular exopolysaccharide synthesis family protein